MTMRQPILFWLVLIAAVGAAQHAAFPGPPRLPDIRVEGRWLSVAELAASGRPAWRTAARVLGPEWQVGFHGGTGSPVWIFGPGVALAPKLGADARTVTLAREMVARLAAALGVRRLADLELYDLNATRTPTGGTIVGVDFAERYRGYPVKNHEGPRLVRLRFHGETGKLFVLGSVLFPPVDLEIRNPLPERATFARCQERLADLRSYGPLVHYERYVLALPDGFRLVDEHHFLAEDPPHRWVFLHDARTGELLWLEDRLVYDTLTGNVAGGVLLNGGGSFGTFKVMPLRDLRVAVAGIGTTYTDAQGTFSVTTPNNQSRTVSGRLVGRYVNVNSRVGGNLSFSQSVTPGTPANIVLNPKHTEYSTAQTTAYYHVTAAWHYVQRYFPTMPGNLRGLPANVNDTRSRCNAFFDGRSINFFAAGGPCNNAAIAEVIIHEWGHAFHLGFHRSVSPLDFSEGLADHIALFWTGQRLMGRGFFVNGAVIRDYRRGGNACCTVYPSSSPDPHRRGEAWAGACLDIRDNLIAKHGFGKGVAIAETDTIAQYRRNPANMPAAVFETFVQDDDDGNLLNGTPNFFALARAVDAHGFKSVRPPDPQIVDMQITHTPLTGTRTDVVNPTVITAKVQGLKGRKVAKVEVTYDEGSGPVTAAMTPVGQDLYRLRLPPRKPLTSFRYTLRATNDLQVSLEVGPYAFRTGRLQRVVLAEDFEGGWNGWSHKKVLKEDDWMLGPPNPRKVNPLDPLTAVSGRNVVGNDLGPLGFDGYYSPSVMNYLESPPFDPGTTRNVYLRFHRWLTYKQGDVAWIDVNLTRVWLGPNRDFSDRRWVEEVLPLPVAPGTNRIRFYLLTDPSRQAGGWNLDDVVVDILGKDLVALRASTTTPPVNTPFTLELETLGGPGYPVAVLASGLAGRMSLPNVQDPVLILPPYVPIFHGNTGPTAKVKMPLFVPALLKGIPIHFQALAVSPRSGNILSNRLTVTAR